jgi:ubiquinone/menaquinone biosynthesis C-methylase UbiE
MTEKLKSEVVAYWNNEACGTSKTSAAKYSKKYFAEIEEYRYRVEPEIFSFAQFTRFRNQKVLEVGIGAGTDFVQWIKAGAHAYGVDITEEAVEHVKNRLQMDSLAAEDVRVADAENLPFDDESFDLIYSWGVIHHSPDTLKALSEIIRCTKKSGIIKIMVYNRKSLNAFYLYLRHGFLKLKPFRTFSDVIYHHMESIGTKAYTIPELTSILSSHPVKIKSIKAAATYYDLLSNQPFLYRFLAYCLACVFGFHRCGWFITMELEKN